jgi:hypothetical protein
MGVRRGDSFAAAGAGSLPEYDADEGVSTIPTTYVEQRPVGSGHAVIVEHAIETRGTELV